MNETKFKIGDRVKIISNENLGEHPLGTVWVIVKITYFWYSVEYENETWRYDESELELVSNSFYNINETKQMETIQGRKVKRFFTEKKLDSITDIIEDNEELIGKLWIVANYIYRFIYDMDDLNEALEENADNRNVESVKRMLQLIKELNKDIEKDTILQQLLQFVEPIKKKNK